MIQTIIEELPTVAAAQVVICDDQLCEEQVCRDEVCGGHSERRDIVAFLLPDLAYIVAEEERVSHTVEWQRRSVLRWNRIFDLLYNLEPPNDNPALNTIGWVDTATDTDLSAEEMHRWLSDAACGILSLEPRRVLEIGCGTGMILYRVAPHCEHFHATDISRRMLDQLKSRRGLEASQGGLPTNVTLEQAAADELRHRFDSFDVVVINSVVQYFPSIQYLRALLQGMAESLPNGGAIYLGDIRSLPLLESYFTDVLLTQAEDDESLSQLWERVAGQWQCESELIIDPAFFGALRQVISRVVQVDVLPKRGRGTSEMFLYRYQVVLRIGESLPVPTIEPLHTAWLDWREGGLNMDCLRRRLTDEAPETLALAAVPNARHDRSRAIAELMKAGAGVATVGELRRRLPAALGQNVGVEPEDLWSLSGELGYVMKWSWARHGPEGHFDVYLTRGDLAGSSNGPTWPESVEGPVAADGWSTLATRPFAGRLVSTLPAAARAHVEDRGLGGPMPDRYVVRPTCTAS